MNIVDQQTFRDAMSCMGAAVNIITTDGPAGRAGFTARQTGVTGCPQLEEALVSFDCRISQVVSVGTHDILFCAIEAIHRHATPYGLVWFDRSYHALMRPAC